MISRRRFIHLSLLLLVGTTALFTFVLGRSERSWSRLPSGTEIRLVAMTSGTNQHLVVGLPWQRVLHRVLPSSWKARSGCTVLSFSNPDTESTFWLQERNLGRTDQDGSRELKVSYLDRYGCELIDNGSSTLSSLVPNGTRYTGLKRDIYGAHGEIVALRVREESGLKETGSVVLARPGISPPAWRTAPPREIAVQGAGDLRIHLQSFTTGLQAAPPAFNLRTWTPQFSQLEFLVTGKDGSIRPEWTASFLRLLTPDGASIPEGLQQARRDDSLILNFDGLLSTTKKIPFEVTFTQQANFAPDQLVTFPPTLFPREENRSPEIEAVCRGVKLRLTELGAPDVNRPPSLGIPTNAYVCVTAEQRPSGLNIWLTKATDDQGPLLFATSSARGDRYYFEFLRRAPKGDISLTFLMHPSYRLRFEEAPKMP
jgi:hypothetical protein